MAEITYFDRTFDTSVTFFDKISRQTIPVPKITDIEEVVYIGYCKKHMTILARPTKASVAITAHNHVVEISDDLYHYPTG